MKTKARIPGANDTTSRAKLQPPTPSPAASHLAVNPGMEDLNLALQASNALQQLLVDSLRVQNTDPGRPQSFHDGCEWLSYFVKDRLNNAYKVLDNAGGAQ